MNRTIFACCYFVCENHYTRRDTVNRLSVYIVPKYKVAPCHQNSSEPSWYTNMCVVADDTSLLPTLAQQRCFVLWCHEFQIPAGDLLTKPQWAAMSSSQKEKRDKTDSLSLFCLTLEVLLSTRCDFPVGIEIPLQLLLTGPMHTCQWRKHLLATPQQSIILIPLNSDM